MKQVEQAAREKFGEKLDKHRKNDCTVSKLEVVERNICTPRQMKNESGKTIRDKDEIGKKKNTEYRPYKSS